MTHRGPPPKGHERRLAWSGVAGAVGSVVVLHVALAQTVMLEAPTAYPVGLQPQSLAPGDFNRDGAVDIAVSNFGSDSVSVLLGNGDGTFQAAASYVVGDGPASLALADFNGDGLLDLVTANLVTYNVTSPSTVSVLLGNGNGTFQAAQHYPAGNNPNSVTVADFNGDGRDDLALATFGAATPAAVTISVLIGNGDGTLQPPAFYTAGRGPIWITASDLDGDGRKDLVVANFGGVDTVSALLGNGDGTFQAPRHFAAAGPSAVAAADFDGDGIVDLAATNYYTGRVSVLMGTGGGFFLTAATYTVGPSPVCLTITDFDGNGRPDLAVANWDGNAGRTFSILSGLGNGAFAAAQNFTAGQGVVAVAAADFDGDGQQDVAVVSFAAGTLSVVLNSTPPAAPSLVVSKAGAGIGAVASSPAGIDCGPDCLESYTSGTVVTLTATPAGGSTFAAWSGGGCSGIGSCQVTMTAATTVTAMFDLLAPQTFALTVSKSGAGSGTVTSSPSGISCGADCSESYTSGTPVTLTATPAGGSTFAGWSGACSGTGSCQVTMTAATTVTAMFDVQAPQTFPLTVNKSGTGSGTVTSSPAGINCGADCSESYTSGTVVTLTATPASGSAFAGWSGACSGTGACNVTMTAATSVTATFNTQQFTLSVAKSGGGSGTVTSSPAGLNCGADCSESYTSGTAVTLTATPAGGSTFAGWSGACSGAGNCQVTMNAAESVTAAFGSLALSAPVLKWQYGGCTAGPSCQTGWYASPAVADLDADGQPDVVWGGYDVVALNGSTGGLKWRGASGNRIWAGIAVADLSGDGTLEVVVGRSADQLTVYNRTGGVLWTRSPFGSGELRSLAVEDLEGDGQLEILVGHAGGGAFHVNVLNPNGATRSGWPARHAGEPGFGDGLYNQNLAVADMNGDGLKEVFAPTSGHYVTALDRNGGQLRVASVYAPRLFWSETGIHVDHAVDLRGFANCGVEHRPNFQDSPPVVADVDGDGVRELIVVGNVHDCSTNESLYQAPFILRLDRTRWSGSGFDWTAIPVPELGSAPRSEDWSVIETAAPNPVVADLDGDGREEILYPSYDGRLHAVWLDKTEHGSWPYTVPSSGAGGDTFRFASEPVVADLDDDGLAEVLFTSWPKKGTGRVGQLIVLSHLGQERFRVDLPAPAGATWNGGLGAPTLANVDADPDLELLVGTAASGLVAYDLPNSASARILWGTGRGGVRRAGTP